MRRHWLHWFGIHARCHPSRCRQAADICNALESEQRLRDYYHDKEGRLL